MTGQIDQIKDQVLLDTLNTVSLGSAGLAEGTGAHTLLTGQILHYRINGQAYVKAATDNIAWPTALTTVIANGVTAYYLITIDTSGALHFTFPPAARTGDPDTTGLLLGAKPANQAVIGIMKLVTTAAFTHGTTDLATQGTFANINSYPADGDPTVFTYA
jgi:hypothetical protein